MSFISPATKFIHNVDIDAQNAARSKPYDIGDAETQHTSRKTEMGDIRTKLQNIDDMSDDYLKLLDRYEKLVKEEESEQDALQIAMQKGPPANLSGAEKTAYNDRLQKLNDSLSKTINGDDDGDVDGGHDLGRGRYLVSINSESDSMLGTTHHLLHGAADEGRTLQLNRNVFDPDAADYKFNSPPKEGFRDPDLVKYGDMVVIGVKPSLVPKTPVKPEGSPPLDPDVQAEVDKSKANHPDDKDYAKGLDDFVKSDDFRNLKDKDKQIYAVGGYDRTVSQAARSTKPFTLEQNAKLQKLLTSDGFYNVSESVRERVMGLFSEYAYNAPYKADAPDLRDNVKLDKLSALINSPAYKTIDNEHKEFQILDGYQHDGGFADKVDKLVADQSKSPADQKAALDSLRHEKYGD